MSDIPKIDLGCLTSSQKDAIIICDEENRACHDALEHASQPMSSKEEWVTFFSAFVLGAATGVVAAFQFHH